MPSGVATMSWGTGSFGFFLMVTMSVVNWTEKWLSQPWPSLTLLDITNTELDGLSLWVQSVGGL